VSWYEAVAFARWLTNSLHEAELLYPDWAVQLPNEPEWEKAGRGGHQIPAAPVMQVVGEMDLPPVLPFRLIDNPLPQRLFPWGNEIDPDRANYERTEIGSTSVVGGFPLGASPYGVEEMSGNVWEWTRSLLRDLPYPADARGQASRENLAAHAEAARVLRGGAFHFYEYFVRCSERYGCNPDELGKLYGFRVIVKPAAPERAA
jgi:iron(II)-dependent oxidoreductase